jgi:hypothetical protein
MIHWGITYYKPASDPSMAPDTLEWQQLPDGLPLFPNVQHHVLAGFVDATHANDLQNHCSPTGYTIMLTGGAISYCTKTQSITVTSSTEAEFLAAVLAVKHAKYLHAVLHELEFSQHAPTPIYEDNMSAINMINAHIPME